MRQHRIGLAVACLHISAVLYLAVGVGMFFLFSAVDDPNGMNTPIAVFMLAFCLGLIVGIEVVGLRRRKFWAWVAGLCVFGMYATSLFLPLGALGLWGLLDEGSRAEFGVGSPQARGSYGDRRQSS